MDWKFSRAVLFCWVFVFTASLWARDDMRVAHVDTKLIFEGYKAVQTAQKEYEAQLAVWEQQANLLQKELDALRNSLDRQALVLSDEKRRQLQGQLEAKQAEQKAFVDEIYGPKGKMVAENQRISAPALAKIKTAIQEVALQEGYDLVVDRATGAVVFWQEEHDLTKRVLVFLNGSSEGPVVK
jgi:outer membrane protein